MIRPLRLTRRGVLRLAAAFPIPGLVSRLKAAGPGPIITRLSNYMSDAGARALPAEAAEKTKHHILDTLAAMISGADLPPGRVATQHPPDHPGANPATTP